MGLWMKQESARMHAYVVLQTLMHTWTCTILFLSSCGVDAVFFFNVFSIIWNAHPSTFMYDPWAYTCIQRYVHAWAYTCIHIHITGVYATAWYICAYYKMRTHAHPYIHACMRTNPHPCIPIHACMHIYIRASCDWQSDRQRNAQTHKRNKKNTHTRTQVHAHSGRDDI